jgi:hypothetical protein
VAVPPGGPRTASTPGWTTRAPRRAHPGSGVYPEPDGLTASLQAGGSSGTSRGVSHRARPCGRGHASSRLSPWGAGRGGQITPPTDSEPHRAHGSCHRLGRPRLGWWPAGGREEAAADEPPPTHGAACRMLRTMLAPSRLPVQHRGYFHRPLPHWRAAAGQRRPPGGGVEPVSTDHPGPRCRPAQEIAPNARGEGHGHETPSPAGDNPVAEGFVR